MSVTACSGPMEMAIAEYGDRALALKDYIPAACARVAGKYECHGDECWHARNWALDTAKEYAAQDGLRFASEAEAFFDTPTHQEGEPAHA